jgi:hypothetical protein
MMHLIKAIVPTASSLAHPALRANLQGSMSDLDAEIVALRVSGWSERCLLVAWLHAGAGPCGARRAQGDPCADARRHGGDA